MSKPVSGPRAGARGRWRGPLAAVIGAVVAASLLAAGPGQASTVPAAAERAGVAPRSPSAANGTWSAIGGGVPSGLVAALAMTRDDTLFVGGVFERVGGGDDSISAPSVAAWANDTWYPLALGLDSGGQGFGVRALAVADDTLFAGGNFNRATGDSVATLNGIAAWADDTWSRLSTGVSISGTFGNVLAFVQRDDTLYAGGNFTTAGGVSANRIAAWADDTWSPLGVGLAGGTQVNALAMLDDTLYAGGNFTTAGGVSANFVAAWADGTWSPLGTGLSGSGVSALTILDDTVYVGGGFTTAGVVTANNVAAWSNDTWHALGAGLNGAVRALATDDTRGLVYAGGFFTTTTGGTSNALNRVAAWDPGIQEWIPFRGSSGSIGVDNAVLSMVVDDSVVYVGGSFTNVANRIAKWTWAEPQGSNSVNSFPVTITGANFIGVPATGGVKVGGTVVTYTRINSTQIQVTSANGAPEGPIEVNGVGGWGNVGTYSAGGSPGPAPTPVFAPSAPTSASGQAGNGSATVSWAAPADTGSFPITNYQVVSTPSGGTCLVAAPALSCEVTGLVNGTTYTFAVRALSGAGWSNFSSASNPVRPTGATPAPAPVPVPPLEPGQSQLVVDGKVQPVRVDPTTRADGLTITGEDFSMNLKGLDSEGKPLNLSPDGALILNEDRQVDTSGAGFQAESEVDLYIDPPPAATRSGAMPRAAQATYVGTLTTDAKGSFAGRPTLPAGISAGKHVLQAVGRTRTGEPRAMSLGVLVTPDVSITLTKGSRTKDGRNDRIRATGTTSEVPAGTRLVPYIQYRGEGDFTQGKAAIVVQADGTFTWTRQVKGGKAITAFVAWEDIASNRVVWARIR